MANDMPALPTLRQLPPSSARLCLEIRKFLQKYCPGDAGLVLAVSGGADSTAMLLILAILAQSGQTGYRLSVLHVDHDLRANSARDAQFVKDLCASLSIPCRLEKINIKKLAERRHWGLEETGRAARLVLLERYRRTTCSDYILTAHHAADLCEDVVMRLLRGSGWPALAGMREKTGHILRPFLYIQPQKLRDFLKLNGCSWVEDESNSEQTFLRNRVRQQLMPIFLKENPAFPRGMANLNILAAIDAAYWDEQLDLALVKAPWILQNNCKSVQNDNTCALAKKPLRTLFLPYELLRGLHVAARLRLYHRAIKVVGARKKSQGQARAETIFRLDSAWQAKTGGKIFQFPGKISATVEKKGILFSLMAKQPAKQN